MHNCQNEVCDESGFSLRPLPFLFQLLYITVSSLAWENTRHFAMQPVVSPWNDIWEMSAEIPYWWGVTTQIWVVLLIGWSKFPTNKKLFPDLASMHHQYGISSPVSQTPFGGEATRSFAKCQSYPFYQSWTPQWTRVAPILVIVFYEVKRLQMHSLGMLPWNQRHLSMTWGLPIDFHCPIKKTKPLPTVKRLHVSFKSVIISVLL